MGSAHPFYAQFQEFSLIHDTPSRPNACERCQHWSPPEEPTRFERNNNKLLYHLWQPGKFTPVNLAEQSCIQPYCTTSMIWCRATQNLGIVNCDCTEEPVRARRVADPNDGWGQVTFQRMRNENPQTNWPGLWLLGHNFEHDAIKAPEPASRWVRKLLSDAYVTTDTADAGEDFGPVQLAGTLSVVLGAIAFSVPWDGLAAAIKQSFRPDIPQWQQPAHPRPENHHRGLVIQIGTGPHSASRETLRRWELGRDGPMLSVPPELG